MLWKQDERFLSKHMSIPLPYIISLGTTTYLKISTSDTRILFLSKKYISIKKTCLNRWSWWYKLVSLGYKEIYNNKTWNCKLRCASFNANTKDLISYFENIGIWKCRKAAIYVISLNNANPSFFFFLTYFFALLGLDPSEGRHSPRLWCFNIIYHQKPSIIYLVQFPDQS